MDPEALKPLPSQPAAPTDKTTPPTPPVPKSRKKLLITLLTIVVLLLVSGTVYLLAMRSEQKDNKNITQVTPTTVQSTTVVPRPVENVETYTNSQYQFTFKYPKGWITADSICNLDFFCLSVRGAETYPVTYTGSYSGGLVTKKQYNEAIVAIDNGEFPEGGTASNPKIVTINGKKMLQSTSWGFSSDSSQEYAWDLAGNNPSNNPHLSKNPHYILSTEILTEKVHIILSVVLPVNPGPSIKATDYDANSVIAEKLAKQIESNTYSDSEVERVVKEYQNLRSSLILNK